MIGAMLQYLSENGLSIAGMILLAIILYDEKALERLERHRIRRLMLVPIAIYFVLVVIELVGIGIRYSSS